jgi:hypothetical protein
MTTESTHPLTPDQRHWILSSVYRELLSSCGPGEGELVASERTKVLETHLDALVDIVRRSTAKIIEPYLVQIMDDVCSHCPHQIVSGYCPQRATGPCIVFRFADPIVRGIRRALEEMGDEPFLAVRAPA